MWMQEQNPGMEGVPEMRQRHGWGHRLQGQRTGIRELWGEGAMAYDKRDPVHGMLMTWLPCCERSWSLGFWDSLHLHSCGPTKVSRDLDWAALASATFYKGAQSQQVTDSS